MGGKNVTLLAKKITLRSISYPLMAEKLIFLFFIERLKVYFPKRNNYTHNGPNNWWVDYSLILQETGVQSQAKSYQRLKKWHLMSPCLTLSIIRYRSKGSGVTVLKQNAFHGNRVLKFLHFFCFIKKIENAIEVKFRTCSITSLNALMKVLCKIRNITLINISTMQKVIHWIDVYSYLYIYTIYLSTYLSIYLFSQWPNLIIHQFSGYWVYSLFKNERAKSLFKNLFLRSEAIVCISYFQFSIYYFISHLCAILFINSLSTFFRRLPSSVKKINWLGLFICFLYFGAFPSRFSPHLILYHEYYQLSTHTYTSASTQTHKLTKS